MSVFKIPSQPLHCRKTSTQSLGLQSCVQFYPAVLKFSPSPSLGWHIEYYAQYANDSKLARYRVRLNIIKRRFHKMSEFYDYAHMLVAEINSALSQGWIPNQKDLTSMKEGESPVPKSLMTMPITYVPTNNVPTSEHIGSTHVYVSMINELQKEVSQLKDILAKCSTTNPVVAELLPTNTETAEQPVEVEFVPSIPIKVEKVAESKPVNDCITLVELLD